MECMEYIYEVRVCKKIVNISKNKADIVWQIYLQLINFILHVILC